MSRSRRAALVGGFVSLLVLGMTLPASAGVPVKGGGFTVQVPRSATPGRMFEVTVSLPATVAAVDGRVLVAKGAAELIGVAPVGAGSAFRPETVPGGYSFGAYALRPHGNRTILRLVVDPRRAGRLEVRVLIDAVADRGGARLSMSASGLLATVGVTGSSYRLEAPASASWDAAPTRAAVPARDAIPDGRINRQDLDIVREGWQAAREQGRVCGNALEGDANGDGCLDIVDVQALLAAQGRRTLDSVAATPGGKTYTVTSTADTADASPGDGICADALGQCTLRAAMTEADWIKGDDRIEFNLQGQAPVTIQLTGKLPMITARNGFVTIDGYTQQGSQVNTATVGSNAIPGVEIRGNGSSAKEVGFRITSAGNTLRGLIIQNIWRGIFLDGTGAHDNQIIGNWVGYRKDGTTPSSTGQYGIILNTGSFNNVVGTPNLADRNMIGNWQGGIDAYGPGTDGSTIQNNVFCIRPSGFAAAPCSTGIDHNFGPKNELIGGNGPNQRNVFGPSFLQGIEYSHGYNPSLPYGTDTATTYQINGNRAIGNWVGFRGDGSYDPNFRAGLNFSSGDNGQAINCYDGSNDNTIKDNYVAAVYDGIQVEAPNAKRNIVQGNVIGVSPLGEAAPLTGWGIKIRWGTTLDVVEGNTIRNAVKGGIGLLTQTNTGAPMSPAYNITLSQNIISDTSGPAIYLQPSQSNPTKGSNDLAASPVIGGATTALVTGTSARNATVELYQADRPAGGAGLPVAYLGAALAGGDGKWSFTPTTVAVGDRITALQIRQDKNTSALATNVDVVAAPLPPQPGDPLASDDFERTLASGWGDATTGGTWALTGTAADFSVSGGAGSVSVAAGQSRQARLAVATADVWISGTVSLDRVPVGGNAFVYLDARANGTNAYRATIRVSTTGAVFVQLKKSVAGVESNVATEAAAGFTATPGSRIAFRFEVAGTQLQFRAWDAGGVDPGTWQTSALDNTAGLQGTGAAGIRAFTGGPVSNGPVVFYWDGIQIQHG